MFANLRSWPLSWILVALQTALVIVLVWVGSRRRQQLVTLKAAVLHLTEQEYRRRGVSAQRSQRVKREAADALVACAALFERLADAVEDGRGTAGVRAMRSQALRLLADDCRQSAATLQGALKLSLACDEALPRVGVAHAMLRKDLASVLALAALLSTSGTTRTLLPIEILASESDASEFDAPEFDAP